MFMVAVPRWDSRHGDTIIEHTVPQRTNPLRRVSPPFASNARMSIPSIPQDKQAADQRYRHGDDADFEEFPGSDLNLFTPKRNEPENRRE